MAVRENGLDGVMTLRPDPHRLKLSAALVPLTVAIILSLRMPRYGWLGVVFIVATLGGIVAVASGRAVQQIAEDRRVEEVALLRDHPDHVGQRAGTAPGCAARARG